MLSKQDLQGQKSICVTNFGSWSLELFSVRKCALVSAAEIKQYNGNLLGCLFQEKILKINFTLIYSSLPDVNHAQ